MATFTDTSLAPSICLYTLRRQDTGIVTDSTVGILSDAKKG
jgi:hypothetical protein